jgi:transcriptional regulator with XRE-family HTH domain
MSDHANRTKSGIQQADLLEEFGNKTTASQILNRRRALTLPVIRRLAARLGLSMALLTQEYPLAPEAVAEQADFRSRLVSGIARR